MEDLLVYQRGIGFIGDISEYLSLEEERNYTQVSKLILRINKSDNNINLLRLGNLISFARNPNYMYVIDHFSLIKEGKKDVIEVYAFSLNFILSKRTVLRQQVFNGNIENVVKSFISSNCINATDSRRNLPQLALGPNTGISYNLRSSYTGGDLLSNSLEIMSLVEGSVDIIFNPDTNNFEVITFVSPDRSILQNINNHVIFSTDYDNVLSREYFIDRINYKNVTIVAGEGTGSSRILEVIGDESGWDRRELYVDARDIQSTYFLEDGTPAILSQAEYRELLNARGLERNASNVIVESYESSIDREQFIPNVDFGIGDRVTFYDRELNITGNVRVNQIKTIIDINGIQVIPSFGSILPNNLLR